jgi:hypothetical protein
MCNEIPCSQSATAQKYLPDRSLLVIKLSASFHDMMKQQIHDIIHNLIFYFTFRNEMNMVGNALDWSSPPNRQAKVTQSLAIIGQSGDVGLDQ